MRIVAFLGTAMVMLGAVTFVWHVKLLDMGTDAGLGLFAIGALLVTVSFLVQHRESRPSTRLEHPTL